MLTGTVMHFTTDGSRIAYLTVIYIIRFLQHNAFYNFCMRTSVGKY